MVVMSAEMQPELGDVIAEEPEKRTEWPEQLHGFTRAGAFTKMLRRDGIFAVIDEIDDEMRRSGAKYRTYAQYDRLFAAARSQSKLRSLRLFTPYMGAIRALEHRVTAARNNGMSEWQFFQAEERRRAAEAEDEARMERASDAAAEAAKVAAHRAMVSKFEAEYRARKEARDNVYGDRENPDHDPAPYVSRPSRSAPPPRPAPRQPAPRPQSVVRSITAIDPEELAERERRQLAKEAQARADDEYAEAQERLRQPEPLDGEYEGPGDPFS